MSEWQPIETAPEDVEALFWLCPLIAADPHFVDANTNPILWKCEARIFMGKRNGWQSLQKATHWMPLPSPPGASHD